MSQSQKNTRSSRFAFGRWFAFVCIISFFLVGAWSETSAQVPDRTEYYGDWQPPNNPANRNSVPAAESITSDNFRSFFPPRQTGQSDNRQANGSYLQPRDEQADRNNVPKSTFAPAPQRHVPAQARPLQPMLGNAGTNSGSLQGRVLEGSDFEPAREFQPARIAKLPAFPNSNVVSPSAPPASSFIPAVQPSKGINSNVRQANFESLNITRKNFPATNFVPPELSVPERDPNTSNMEGNFLGTNELANTNVLGNLEQAASSTSGNLQSWFKNTTGGWFDGLQSKGGWGEKLSGLFGGMNESTRKMLASLTVVLGGYFAFVALMRRLNPKSNRGIPSEVVEVVGNTPFGPRKNLQLVRLGSKLLLLMNTPEGTHPVGEITDPTEVEYLISLCSGKRQRASRPVMSAVDQLKTGRIGQSPTMNSLIQAAVGATPVGAAANAIANSGASTTAINEVLRALESRKTPTAFEA
jgi:flagellar biogenesis protein FliO